MPRERKGHVSPPRGDANSRPAPRGLQLTGLSKSLRASKPPVAVLKDASLRCEPGTVTWLTGPNGSGKTTLLRLIAGLLSPDAGRITFGSLDAERSRRAYQGEVGWLPAGDRGLYARISVRKHLDIWARIAFVPAGRREQSVSEALQAFGLDQLAGRRTDRLSVGQRQRVSLALTFLHRPSLVLLDEPMSSLDAEGLEVVREAASSTTRRGGLVLWASPPDHRAAIESDVHVMLEDGQVHRA